MMKVENIQVQLVDTPSLDPEYTNPGVFDLVRRSDLVLVVLDLQADPFTQYETTLTMLSDHRISLHKPGTAPESVERFTHIPAILLVNKCDDAGSDDDFAVLSAYFKYSIDFWIYYEGPYCLCSYFIYNQIRPDEIAGEVSSGAGGGCTKDFNFTRAARLVEQNALDPTLPGLDDVLERLVTSASKASPRSPYEAEIARAVERVLAERLMGLAGGARMPQVRALATDALQTLGRAAASSTGGRLEAAHESLLAQDIRRFLERPAASLASPSIPVAPPGPPIGEPALDDLRSLETYCPMIHHGNDATRLR